MKISDQELLDALKEFYNQNGKSPTQHNFSNKSTYNKRFGSWNKALEAAELPTRSPNYLKKITHKCECCENMTNNPRFCSKSCSAKIINKNHPKRKRYPRTCKSCQKQHTEGSRRFCQDCIDIRNSKIYGTLGDLSDDGHRASKYAIIRQRARKMYQNEIASGCQHCGYSKHAEACHRKPINEFSDDTLIEHINSKENILILCRNCHWEFDHNMLDI